jgi:ankyrin repeat protein
MATSSLSPRDHALLAAAKRGDLSKALRALEGGARIESRDDEGWSAAMRAAQNGHAACLAFLLDHGADANARSPIGWTALLAAAQHGRFECAKLLLDRGVDPNVQSQRGWSALMLAAQQGNSCVALLAARGAVLEAKNFAGSTAAFFAARHGHLETLKKLERLGADVSNCICDDPECAAFLAAQAERRALGDILAGPFPSASHVKRV